MTTAADGKFHQLFKTIIQQASEEERDELAREVERIEADFHRFSELLSCLETEDQSRLLQILGIVIGGAIVLANREIPEPEIAPRFNPVNALLCVASLTANIENMCLSTLGKEHGEAVCRNNLSFAKKQISEM